MSNLKPARQRASGLAAEHQKTAMLMTSGIAGQARIDQVNDTGTTINDNPRVQFTLTVTIPGREPYPATLTQVVRRESRSAAFSRAPRSPSRSVPRTRRR